MVLGLVACAVCAWAQAGGPHIGYVYPAGGKQGSSFQVVVGGQLLGGANGVWLSGEGAHGRVVEYIRPLNNDELRDTEWVLRELVRRRWSARTMDYVRNSDDPPELPDHPWLRDLDHKTPGEIARLRNRLFDPKNQLNTQLAEQVTVEVTVAPEAPVGTRELRLLTPNGVSNALCFEVAGLPEVCEEDLEPDERARAPLALPVMLNGQITPGDADYFRLQARKGQRLVMRAQARALVPYLADAVPGWFQAVLSLRDAAGREVAEADDYHFDPDPMLLYEVPADGVYELEIRDAIYRGRDDFVYRVAVGELPFVTDMFPLGGQAGVPTTASIAGWNLPARTLQLDTSPGGEPLRRTRPPDPLGVCNAVPYAVDSLPESLETEPNNTPQQAQHVSPPLIINGRIGQAGDVDTFRFTGRAGEEVVAEVNARRLNSPLDSLLRLVGTDGQVVASSDDYERPERGLITHHADSYLRVRLPQDGEYMVVLSDIQSHGGDEYAYRLRLGPPQPDFALRVTPSGVSLRPGRSASLTVHAVRKDGFDSEIQLALKDAPEGFTLRTEGIPSDKDNVDVTLSAPRDARPQTFALHLQAQATIGEETITRPVVPAEDMMQAFLWRHIVPQQQLLVSVPGPKPVPAVWRPLVAGLQLATSGVIQLPLDGTAQVQVKAPSRLPGRPSLSPEGLRFTLAAAPRGVSLAGSSVGPTGIVLLLRADLNIAREGDSGNAIINVSAPPEGNGEQRAGAAYRPWVSLGVLPPIPLQIVQ